MLFLRFRVLIIAFSIVATVFLFGVANLCYRPWSVGWLRLVDFSFWILFAGCFLAGFVELRLFWRRSPVLSTLLVNVLGLGIALISRLSSAVYSLLKTSFFVQPLGGSIIDDVSYMLASFTVLGAFMILASTALSTWFKEPVVFVKSLTFCKVFYKLAKVLNNASAKWVYIACFAIGFLVRLYPELKHLSLPIGWDTLEYIANARDFAYEPKLLTRYIWLGAGETCLHY